MTVVTVWYFLLTFASAGSGITGPFATREACEATRAIYVERWRSYALAPCWEAPMAVLKVRP